MSTDQCSTGQRKQESVFWARGVDTCSWGIDTWNPKMLKESTHASSEQFRTKVSTHDDSIQQSEIKMLTVYNIF